MSLVNSQRHYAGCHYAEVSLCWVSLCWAVITHGVIMLGVIKLGVKAPSSLLGSISQWSGVECKVKYLHCSNYTKYSKLVYYRLSASATKKPKNILPNVSKSSQNLTKCAQQQSI